MKHYGVTDKQTNAEKNLQWKIADEENDDNEHENNTEILVSSPPTHQTTPKNNVIILSSKVFFCLKLKISMFIEPIQFSLKRSFT